MPPKSQAHWSDADTTALIDFLWSQRATLGDGASFKSTVWTDAATKVNALTRTKGTDKTSSSCKNKWARLKEIYNIIVNIKAQSGFTWDDEKGADVKESTALVWKAYEEKHKGSTPFRNKGWIWLRKVEPLMPTAPRGANIYRPSRASQLPEHESQESEVEEDSQELERPVSNWSPSPPPEVRPHRVQPNLDNEDPSDDMPPTATQPPATPVPPQQTPAPALKRKHSALSAENTSTTKRTKSDACPSGAVALHGINERLDDFTDIFREAISGKKSGVLATPSRKSQAMQRAQKLETALSDRCIVGLIDLFQADVSMADAYLSLTREGVRNQWVAKHIKHIREEEETEDDIFA
ncbi:hypothetical protein BDZ97DRAFT_1763145 [Flammula alnicola]|nr:hypothetical protein BDZ97DRAFT_1763145 [Flammula alnicola]